MADSASSPPPLDRIFLVGIWIETVLYGMNCIIFAGALYVLLGKRSGGASPKFLIVVACWLFVISTTHVALVLRQLLEAFIYGRPGGAILYFANQASPIPVAKLVLYSTNVFTQDLILIWRLWVIWGRNWKIVIGPLIIEFVHISAAYIAAARGAQPGVPVFDKLLHNWAIVTWSLDLTVNIGVTGLIVYKLWSVGRSVYGLGISRKNKYLSTILTVVESGALFASATIVVVGLYLSGNIAVVAAIDSAVQVATLTPLLIIVRVGFGLTHGRSANETYMVSKTAPGNPSRVLDSTTATVHVTTTVGYELSSLPVGKESKLDV